MSFLKVLFRGSRPVISVVRLSGIIQDVPVLGRGTQRFLNLQTVKPWLDKAFSKRLRPTACALVVNSPGGSAAQSELIFNEVRRLSLERKVPVYAFAEDVAASGGYWLLCAGDEGRVHALPSSIVGSIGVVSSSFGLAPAAERLGVERRLFTAGEDKVIMDPFLPVQPHQETLLRGLLDDLHGVFIDTVTSARGKKLDNAGEENLFTGRVWTGRQAASLGLVDGLGDMENVMRAQFENPIFKVCNRPARRNFLFGFPGMDTGLVGSAAYSAASAASSALLNEVEERAMWARFGVH